MSETQASARAVRAERLAALPPYLFAEIDRATRRLLEAGQDVIDLGVGDPDLPSAPHVIERLAESARDPANHRYSMTEGLPELRAAIAGWYRRRFGVSLDPNTEVLPLLGSKEGIAHLPLAIVNPGDVVLVPDPGYPPYVSGTVLAGADAHPMPLLEATGFFPDFEGLSQRAVRRAKLMFLNYPNNPTAALASSEQFAQAVEFAKTFQILVAHDAAYSELAFDGARPKSFLESPGARDVGVEFHSLSKTWNMTGWRIGWVCGHAGMIAALAKLKTNLDSGIFQPVQWAGIAALEGDETPWRESLAVYRERRDRLVDGLAAAGWTVPKPAAGLYVWARVPGGGSSMAFAERVLEQARVVLTPGVGFGRHGEGYVRMSLTIPTERIEEAVARLSGVL
ncbi:MAG TPA: LL-diaminopimelate aminotransferase [bacterium]